MNKNSYCHSTNSFVKYFFIKMIVKMINIKESCIELLKNEDTRRDIHDILLCISDIVYNELQGYIWLICIYTIFLIFLTLANSVLLLRIFYKQEY